MTWRPKAQSANLLSAIRDLLRHEAAGGIILMVVAAMALIVSNSLLADGYFLFLNYKIAGLSILHWVNDGLMAVFFLLVGLEIKREILVGELASWPLRILPGIAAAGGMIIPGSIYAALNWNDPIALRGWAIPSATDIAFALGVLALLGSRAPASLKVFLATLAILDDLGAVLIIAIFYTAELSMTALAISAGLLAILAALNVLGVTRLWPYLILGGALWFFVLQSGVHATVAGVLLALTIPLAGKSSGKSPLIVLEHAINPWIAFLVVPIFGFANAGVSLASIDQSVMIGTVPMGIALGLFVGKQIGVFGATWLAVKAGLAQMPQGTGWLHIYGVSLLCGIGFTMSLFIGALAFPDAPEFSDSVKVGVLGGSIVSALFGWALLRNAKSPAG